MTTGTDVKLVCMATRLNNKICIFLLLVVMFTVALGEAKDRRSCLRSCVNGNCDQYSNCVCDPCWLGANCDVFYDRHQPRFKERHTKLYLARSKLTTNKPIYTAKAFDDDQWECGSKQGCLCADIRYRLIGSNLFALNSTTGDLYLMDPGKVSSGNDYKLAVVASAVKSNYTDQLNIDVSIEENLGRVKRHTGKSKKSNEESEGGEIQPTSFGLRTLAGDINSIQLGSSIQYKLEIALPRTSVDLVLEIVSTGKTQPALSLYNFTTAQRVPGISFSNPTPKFFMSNVSKNVYDRLLVDLGQVKNNGPDKNVFTVFFSVVLTRNLLKKSETKHSITVSAEYGKGSMVWVAESQVTTAPLTQNDDLCLNNVEFDPAPKTLLLDSAAMFQMNANLEFRSDRLRVEISKDSFEYEPENFLSLGQINVNKFGKNYHAISHDPRYYTWYRNKTVSEYSFSKSVFDMGIITNTGEKSRVFSNNPDNILQFSFTIFALNFPENIGQNASFTVKIFLGNKSVFTKTLVVELAARKAEQLASMLVDSDGHFSSRRVSKGGLTQLRIKSTFAELSRANTFVDLNLAVEVPFAAQKVPLFEPCTGRLVNELSGFNIPYANALSIKPELESNLFVFHFKRIHLFKQQTAAPVVADDNSIVAEIAFRVPFHDDIDDGTTLFANVKVTSGRKTVKVKLEENQVSVHVENRSTEIELSHNRSVAWSNLIVNSGIGLNLQLELPVNSAYQDLQISIEPDSSVANLPQLNICKYSVVKVGSELPCTCVQRENINQNQTKYGKIDETSQFSDRVTLDLGAISITNDDSERMRRLVMTNFIATINSINEELPIYPIKVDIIADGGVIKTEVLQLSVSYNDTTPESIHDLSPKIDVHLLNKGFITAGFTTNILINVNVATNSMGPLLVEVDSEDEQISICGLWIEHIGGNMPCANRKTKAQYQGSKGRNNAAKLQFAMITNFGSSVRKSKKEEARDNTLEFVAMVRVAETATSNKTARIALTYGPRNVRLEHELIIPVNGSSTKVLTDFPKPKQITMNAADGRNTTYEAISKLLYYDIELRENTQAPITILMEMNNDYKICNSAIVKLGKNYPCYSPHTLKVSPGKFELGMVCNTFLYKYGVENNLMRFAVAVRPKAASGQQVKVSSMIYVGQIPYSDKNELILSVESTANYTTNPGTKGATVHAESSDNIDVKIRERKWVAFNVRIPPHTTGRLRLVAVGEADESRIVVILHDLRITSGGANIPCPLDNKPRIQYNSTVATSQKNVIDAELGYFSNYGFSYAFRDKNDTGRLQDDFLRMELLAELTDHPAIVEQGVYRIRIKTYFGHEPNSISREGKLSLVYSEAEEPNPQIDVNIKMRKKLDILDRGDTLKLTATLKHLPESNSEPINVVLRLFTPEFVQLIQIDSANTKELPGLEINNGTDGYADISFPWILFTDEIVLNFTIQMDPKNLRGFGREDVTVVTPYRVMCEHYRMNNAAAGGGAKSPCSLVKHFRVVSRSSECGTPLGLANGNISDSQISASSAIGKEFGPKYVRFDSKRFWAPALRYSKQKEYLQIDFGRRTRVVKLEYKSSRGQRRVLTFHLEHSDNGRIWTAVNATSSSFTFTGEIGESSIKNPVEARYYRFVIDEVELEKKSQNRYVAVRLEFFGCYVQDEQSSSIENDQSTPLESPKTHFTDDPAVVNRHISIDPYTNVIYFCDHTPSGRHHQLCYYSDSNGQTWNVVGRSIDTIEGFELASGKFYAIDHRRFAYLSSHNGLTWTPVSFDEFNRTVTHPKFQRKLVIPQFHKEDIRKMDIKLGNWHVNYDGLFNDESQYAKAFWKNCCADDSQ